MAAHRDFCNRTVSLRKSGIGDDPNVNVVICTDLLPLKLRHTNLIYLPVATPQLAVPDPLVWM